MKRLIRILAIFTIVGALTIAGLGLYTDEAVLAAIGAFFSGSWLTLLACTELVYSRSRDL